MPRPEKRPRSLRFSLQASYRAISPSAALCFVRQSTPRVPPPVRRSVLYRSSDRLVCRAGSSLLVSEGFLEMKNSNQPNATQHSYSQQSSLYPWVILLRHQALRPKIRLPGGGFLKPCSGVLQYRGRKRDCNNINPTVSRSRSVAVEKTDKNRCTTGIFSELFPVQHTTRIILHKDIYHYIRFQK